MPDQQKKIFGLNRNVFFMGLVSFFNDFSNEMIQSVMPSFLALTLGVSPTAIGLIEGVADAIASFLKIISGSISDRIGKRKLLALAGYIISVSMRPLYAFAGSFGAIFKLRAIDRVGKGFREAPRDALLAESTTKDDLGRSFGYHRALDAVGGIAGPVAAVILLPLLNNNYSYLFFISFGIGILALLSFLFIKDIQSKNLKKPRFDFSIFSRHRNFGYFILAIFIFGLGTLPITLMLLRPLDLLKTIGDGSHQNLVPIVYLIYSLAFVFSAIPIGKLSDKIGENKIIPFGFFVAILSYLILGFSNDLPTAVLAFILFGIYSASTDGIERALTSKLVAPELLATGQGFLHAAVGVSSFLAGLIGGILWTKFGSSYAFIYGAGVSLIGFLFFISINFLTPKQKIIMPPQAEIR